MTLFDRTDDFLALPRLAGLILSPDGGRLVTSVVTPNSDGTELVSALWEIDPAGERPARRLTFGDKGERSPVFTQAGDLLFLAARSEPGRAEGGDEPPPALWLLPADGGEARLAGRRAGGLTSLAAARRADTLVVLSPTLPGAVTGKDDEKRRATRREGKVTAILHADYPVRYWDHDLGPDQPRLLAARLTVGETEPVDWTDLTPAPGAALRESGVDLAPDGRTAVASWTVPEPRGARRRVLVAVDVGSGDRRGLLDDPDFHFYCPVISPDGATVAALRERRTTPTEPPKIDLVAVPLAGGPATTLTAGWDRWPTGPRWLSDSSALIVVADEEGRAPLFRVSVPDGGITRLTGDDGAYSDPCPAPDGRRLYALRAAVDAPPTPVRLDCAVPAQRPMPLPGPTPAPALPGGLAEVHTIAEDGTPLRAWLAVPAGAGPARPAPLLLWIHGGPLNSWNTWHWRWNPWLMVARGYAVLLPDPALSTGYGQRFIERGWGAWGAAPYTDLLALTDAAGARDDVDAARTAAMGGSFGGYLANWIAGHTDRFAAIVTHASLWSLEQFGHTTDMADYWLTEMTEEMARANSPHRHAGRIRTPMLVIHGDRDYRVPIGEALRLWWDLLSRRDDPADQPHRFLYFPDENHWVTKPRHAALWYETVLAFLDHHLRGAEFVVPELLR